MCVCVCEIPVWPSLGEQSPPQTPESSSRGRQGDGLHSSGSSCPPPDKQEHNR